MSKFHRETRQPKGQLQYCSKFFGQGNYLAFSGQSSLFYMVREKNTFILVRPLPGCLTRLFSHDSTTISFAAVLDHLNKMTGAKYDGEGDDDDDNGEDGDGDDDGEDDDV